VQVKQNKKKTKKKKKKTTKTPKKKSRFGGKISHRNPKTHHKTGQPAKMQGCRKKRARPPGPGSCGYGG